MSYNTELNLNKVKKNIDNSDHIDFKKIFSMVFQHWLLFILSVVVCLSLAILYASIAPSTWNVSGKILVKDSKNNPQSALSGTVGGDIGSLFTAKSSADNEIQILKSRTLMQSTVNAMQLYVRTFLKEKLKTKEIFSEAPFTIAIFPKADTLSKLIYKINILNEREFIISNSDENVSTKARFGDKVKLRQYDLLLKYIPGAKFASNYEIEIIEPDAAVDNLITQFNATLSDKQATTIDLSLVYNNPEKGEAILNKIMHLYLLSNIQNEKQIADSTMAFIDSRIGIVSGELNNIEKQFEKYKTQNNLANISEQSRSLVSSASEYYDKLTQQQTQLSVIKDLAKYLNDPRNKNVIPSSLINPADQSFGLAINAYNDLLLSRDRSSLSYTEDNPVIQNLDKQINNARLNLLKNIQTYKQSLEVGKDLLEKQNKGFTTQIKTLPGKERNYLDFARQQNLKQELYLFLLQKREETAISRNSTMSSSRVLDTAKSDFSPFKPKKTVFYLVGIVSGILLASIYMFIKQLLDIKIRSKADIEAGTSVVILGEIGHNPDKQNLVTGKNSRSIISEQFRSLRTNLQFILNNTKSNVILFTSSMSGEGKSFLSLNLGSALSLTGKKVVLLEMDLRKPKLSEGFGLTIDNGFTNYAMSETTNFDFKKLLKPLSFNENCYMLSSGPIPPNPVELLMSDKMDNLMAYLKTEFDYIIIDCAPIGLVTDALILEKYADMTLYVTRQNYTYKSQLNILNELMSINHVKNIYLVVNDIELDKAKSTGYKQTYGYGIEEETSWKDKLKFWK